MKKSLVALAVAGAFAAPALADVVLSGAINFGVVATRNSDGSTSTGTNIFGPGNPAGPVGDGYSQNNLQQTYSHIDVESVDDIGGGNQVVFHYQFDISGTANALASTQGKVGNRNSFLGIRGGWGGLYWGTNENIYEQYLYESDYTDGAVGVGGNLSILGTPGIGTVFENGQSTCDTTAGGTGCVGFYRRSDHTIWYASPNWGAFSFGAALTLDAFKTQASGTNPKMYSVGVQFKPEGGPFFVNAAYERHNDFFGIDKISAATTAGAFTSATDTTDTGFHVGGGITFGDVTISARYETLQYEADRGAVTGELKEYERDALFFSGKINVPTGYIAAQAGFALEADCKLVGAASCNANDTDATLLAVGYFHNLSKQSQLQFILSRIDNGDAANYVHAGGPTNQNAVNGASHTALHATIKHVF